MNKMKKNLIFAIVLFSLIMSLSACVAEPTYPYLVYRNSSYKFDIFNKTILIKDGYILNDGNAYNVVEVEGGYDLIIHFIKEK